MKWNEILNLISIVATLISCAAYHSEAWRSRNAYGYNNFRVLKRLQWTYIICTAIFFVSLCYNSYLEWI